MKTEFPGIIIPDFMVFLKCVEFDGKCALDIQKETGITYKHLHELKHTFVKLKWIYLEKEMTRHNIFLTDKGKELVNVINRMFYAMSISYEDMLKYIKDSKHKKSEEVDIEKLAKELGLENES
jgi:replication initiation and membrane attachment protein DnaB